MSTSLSTRRSGGILPWFSRGPIASLRHEMDDLFSRFGSEWDWGDGGGMTQLSSPSLDIAETDNEIEVTMDVPGMKAEELDIEVTGDVIRIRGEHKEETEESGKKFHRVERRTGSFERVVRMPCQVNEQNVDAEYHDGVLTVTLAKAEESRTHKIPVKG